MIESLLDYMYEMNSKLLWIKWNENLEIYIHLCIHALIFSVFIFFLSFFSFSLHCSFIFLSSFPYFIAWSLPLFLSQRQQHTRPWCQVQEGQAQASRRRATVMTLRTRWAPWWPSEMCQSPGKDARWGWEMVMNIDKELDVVNPLGMWKHAM